MRLLAKVLLDCYIDVRWTHTLVCRCRIDFHQEPIRLEIGEKKGHFKRSRVSVVHHLSSSLSYYARGT